MWGRIDAHFDVHLARGHVRLAGALAGQRREGDPVLQLQHATAAERKLVEKTGHLVDVWRSNHHE